MDNNTSQQSRETYHFSPASHRLLAIFLSLLSVSCSIVSDSEEQGVSYLCGHRCLVRAARHFGIPLDLKSTGDFLRLAGKNGSHTMLEMKEALSQMGFIVTANLNMPPSLSDLNTPFIAHLPQGQHFVLVELIKDGFVFFGDHLERINVLKETEFRALFEGAALQLCVPESGLAVGKHSPLTASCLSYYDTISAASNIVTVPVELSNQSTAVIRITGSESTTGELEASIADQVVLAPMSSSVIHLNYRPVSKFGSFNHRVELATDNPRCASIELHFGGIFRDDFWLSTRRVTLTPRSRSARVGLVTAMEMESLRFTSNLPGVNAHLRKVDEAYLSKIYRYSLNPKVHAEHGTYVLELSCPGEESISQEIGPPTGTLRITSVTKPNFEEMVALDFRRHAFW